MEAILYALRNINEVFAEEAPWYRIKVKRQLEQMAMVFSDKYGFSFTLPETDIDGARRVDSPSLGAQRGEIETRDPE